MEMDKSIGDLPTRGGGGRRTAIDLPEGTIVAGRYTLGARIGQGGMGVVYRAQDSRPPRAVALKFLVTRDPTDRSAVGRFLAEAELIAKLNHLNVIQIYEIGEWEGYRYIAMELADGGTLRDLVKSRGKLGVAEAAGLMRQVGQALAYAHRHGVIHRDVKPANILMTREGVPKLVDFGLAKGLTETELSMTGYGMGTLGFMSPEQRRDAKSVDHRTDIYAWGATFYQVVTGKDPLAWDPEEIPAPLRGLIKKCLKERDERFSSMDEALASLEREVETSEKRPAAGVVEEGGCPQCGKANSPKARFCKGCGAGLYEKCPRCGAEDRAPIRFCQECGCDVEKERKAREKLESIRELRSLTGHTSVVLSVAWSADDKLLASGSRDETIRLWDPSSGKELRTLSGHWNWVESVAFSPDGKLLASGSWDSTIRLWDPSSGKELRTLSGHSGPVFSVAFSPDGKMLASGSVDHTIRLWDPSSGEELRTLSGHSNSVESVAFSPDGKMLASGSRDNTIRLWDPSSGKELRTLSGHSNSVESVAFSPDGKMLASGSRDKTIRLWDPFSGKELRTLSGHSDWVLSVAFSPDGKMLASGSRDKTIRLWDPFSGKELRTLSGHWNWVESVAFSPDCKLLASGSGDNTIRLWGIE